MRLTFLFASILPLLVVCDKDPRSSEIRQKWMQVAVDALSDLKSTPCPFEAFGAAIVNHTASAAGELVCIGANSLQSDGNPTLHGEIAAINNCSAIFTSPDGPYELSPAEALQTYSQLSLYTTAEACPMCAAAMAQAGFAEYIYATSMETLIELGWPQIDISSREVFERSPRVPQARKTRILAGVLADETDDLFRWQFQKDSKCPKGCGRTEGGASCQTREGTHDEL